MQKILLAGINLIVFTSSSAQFIGLGSSYHISSPHAHYFPEKSADKGPDFFSYLLHDEDGNSTPVFTDKHYGFLHFSTIGIFGFIDLENTYFITYFEFGMDQTHATYTTAATIDPPPQGLSYFYRTRLTHLVFSAGKAIDYYKSRNNKWQIVGVFLLGIQYLQGSNTEFAFTSQFAGTPSFAMQNIDEAEKRLNTLNGRIFTHQRFHYHLSPKFGLFTGISAGFWINTISKSNELYLSYLDLRKEEYGSLYHNRSGPFFYANVQIGMTYDFDGRKNRGHIKGRGLK